MPGHHARKHLQPLGAAAGGQELPAASSQASKASTTTASTGELRRGQVVPHGPAQQADQVAPTDLADPGGRVERAGPTIPAATQPAFQNPTAPTTAAAFGTQSRKGSGEAT